MAGEIQLNSTTMATESSGSITLTNVDSATNRTNLGLGSIATQAADSVDIDGGAIDGTTIGGTTAAAGTFTTFTSTGIDDNASSTALTIDSSGNLNLNGGGDYQKNSTTGYIVTYGDVAVTSLTTSYQTILITLPNSITYHSVVSIVPRDGSNDIVYISDVALGAWSGVQTQYEARVTIKLGNAVASSTGYIRVYYRI